MIGPHSTGAERPATSTIQPWKLSNEIDAQASGDGGHRGRTPAAKLSFASCNPRTSSMKAAVIALTTAMLLHAASGGGLPASSAVPWGCIGLPPLLDPLDAEDNHHTIRVS